VDEEIHPVPANIQNILTTHKTVNIFFIFYFFMATNERRFHSKKNKIFFMATNQRYTRSPTPPMNRDWRIPVTFSEKKRICKIAKRYWENPSGYIPLLPFPNK
jgi:hypothetical protein